MFANAQIGGVIHCGFDFTSYIVIDAHEDGKSETVNGLRVSVTNDEGVEVININNSLSWQNANKPMVFTRNYKVNEANKRVAKNEEGKWFYYFAEDQYLLSIANTFPADNYSVKIEDIDGPENGGHFKTQIIPLASYNMYVLCSSDERGKAVQFGRRMNRPINVVLEKI